MDLTGFPVHAVYKKARSPADTRALMVVLHGRGDSPAGFDFLPDALAIPELEYLMLQAPDDYFGGYSWYGHSPDQLPGVLRSRQLLEQTFDQLLRQGYRAEQLFLFGFSQGCLMTLEFGSRYPHRLAGYLGISGYVYDVGAIVREASPTARDAAWLVTHGTRDDVLPVGPTREQIEELQAAGFKIEYREYSKTHTIDDELEIPFLREWVQARMPRGKILTSGPKE